MTVDTTRTFQGENGRDEFEREKVADKVISLLTSEIDISPLVIDGGWGTGKTEFCHKLINKFSVTHRQYKLVYVDAFQADHANNPLLTILSAIMAHLPVNEGKQTLLQKSVPVARFMASTLGRVCITPAAERVGIQKFIL